MKNADMSAMPAAMIDTHSRRDDGRDETGRYILNMGLTKREMFAMHAMQGIESCAGQDMDYEQAAVQAVKCADALLAELEKSHE